MPSTQRVSLRLYDVLGREVAVLMNEIQTAGRHRLTFDASGMPSGVYLCRLEAGEMAQTRKIVLIK
ncbi:MAG: T9SS type A sorting domain-containing protein [bacterium]|nr:T9SS type A sorting domain-containing protein [bacterium]